MRVLWNDSTWPFCCGVLTHMRSTLMPRTGMAFLNSPLVYCEPLSHRTRIPLIWSGDGPPAASRTDCTALADLAEGAKTWESRLRLNTSTTLKQ